METPRRSLFIQITIVSAVVLVAIILAVVFIPRAAKPGQHSITLRVESTSGSATIQYDAGQYVQRDSTKTFNTPWERTWVLESGTDVVLTAGNHEQSGTLKCYIKMDGNPWKSDSATMPIDKVACAGIVR
jgi:hypothetical protein